MSELGEIREYEGQQYILSRHDIGSSHICQGCAFDKGVGHDCKKIGSGPEIECGIHIWKKYDPKEEALEKKSTTELMEELVASLNGGLFRTIINELIEMSQRLDKIEASLKERGML